MDGPTITKNNFDPKSAEALLREIYYDPKRGYSSARELYNRVKASQDPIAKHITAAHVKTFLDKQTIKQMRTPKKAKFIAISGDGTSYQADLMFLTEYPRANKGFNTLLNIVNTVTRKAYSYPLKGKTGPQVIQAFDKFMAEVPEKPTHFTTDSEASLAKAIKKHEIPHHRVDPGDKTPVSIVERFNKTLRNKIATYMRAKKTKVWIDVLSDLLENYNTSVHSTTGLAPNSVTPQDIENISRRAFEKSKPALEELANFVSGDKVRVLKAKGIFEKGEPEFSRKIYTVVRHEGFRVVIKGENGNELKRKYRNWELKKINENPEVAPEPTENLESTETVDSEATEEAPLETDVVPDIVAEVAAQVAEKPADEKKIKKFVRLQRRAGLDVDKDGNPIRPPAPPRSTRKARNK